MTIQFVSWTFRWVGMRLDLELTMSGVFDTPYTCQVSQRKHYKHTCVHMVVQQDIYLRDEILQSKSCSETIRLTPVLSSLLRAPSNSSPKIAFSLFQ